MTTEEKFNAAVNVIRNLPKNGSYQPSTDLMLKFYSYFKQATEGPCQEPKPAFWEVVKKAKWTAWKNLDNMSRDEAMVNYVEELKKIVETMSLTENVANFVSSLDSFYESVPVEDLELVVGDVLERIRSQTESSLSDSSIGSGETSPVRKQDKLQNHHSQFETSTESINSVNAHTTEAETEDEFIDTVESVPTSYQEKFIKTYINEVETKVIPDLNYAMMNGDTKLSNHNDVLDHSKKFKKHNVNMKMTNDSTSTDFGNAIAITLNSLQNNLDQVNVRISNIEQQILLLTRNRMNSNQGKSVTRWPLPESNTRLLTLIILWPFVAQFLVYLLKRCNRHKA